MRSLSFLLSRRWVLFAIVVALLAWLAWALGEWQFHRLEDRKERNAIVERNTAATRSPSTTCSRPATPCRTASSTAGSPRGDYDVDDTVVVRYRTRDGASGIDVVVPLVTADGTALLVDRGWLATDNSGASPTTYPPRRGEVTVTGWVRQDASGDSTHVSDQSTRSISSRRSAALGITTYGGFVDLDSEDPRPGRGAGEGGAARPVQRAALLLRPAVVVLRAAGDLRLLLPACTTSGAAARAPSGSGGPAAATHRSPRAQIVRSIPPSTGSMTPVMKDDAGDMRNAAARPNSAGSP